MLSIARRLAPLDVPLIGVNQGRLGFLTDIPLAAHGSDARARCSPAATSRSAARCSRRGRARRRRRAKRALALNDVVVNRGARRHDDRVRGRDRRPLRLRDARRRHHRRDADRLDRVRAVGRRADPRPAASRAFALVPVAPHALTHRPIADRRHRDDHASRVVRGRDAPRPLRRPGALRARRRRARRRSAARRTRRASCIPEGHDYFAMLREKLHWSETPERLRGADRVRALDAPCCACCRSAISSSSTRSTSSSSAGFTVLTGETGAGKSILLDALGLLLGDRFELRQLRAGRRARGARRGVRRRRRAGGRAPGSPTHGARRRRRRGAAAPRARRAGPQPRVDQRPPGDARAAARRSASGSSTSTASTRTSRSSRAEAQRALVDAFGGFAALARETARRVARVARGGRAARCRGSAGAAARGRARVPRGAPARARRARPVATDEWTELSPAQSRLAHAAALIEARDAGAEVLERGRRRARRAARAARRAARAAAAHDPALAEIVDAARARAHPARRGGARAARLPPPARPRSGASSRASRSGSRRSTTSRASTACVPRRCRRCSRETEARARRARRERPTPARSRSARREAEARYRALAERAVGEARASPRASSSTASPRRCRTLAMAGGRLEIALEPLAAPASTASSGRVPGREPSRSSRSGRSRASPRAASCRASRSRSRSSTSEVGAGADARVRRGRRGHRRRGRRDGRAAAAVARHAPPGAVRHAPAAGRGVRRPRTSASTKRDAAAGVESSVAALDRDARIDELARMLAGEEITAKTRAHARSCTSAPPPAMIPPRAPLPSARSRRLRGAPRDRRAVPRPRGAPEAQFMPHLVTFFERDRFAKAIPYEIHIAEQADGKPFNRGAMKNAGFAIAHANADYVVFHDVDYLPMWADYSLVHEPDQPDHAGAPSSARRTSRPTRPAASSRCRSTTSCASTATATTTGAGASRTSTCSGASSWRD